MTLLLATNALEHRREISRGTLAPLFDSLAAELAPELTRDPYFPREKALLSRAGGKCPRCGAMLDFDPHSPHDHRCLHCNIIERGEAHDRWWIYWYQLWLAERALRAATLFRLGGDERHRAYAAAILDGYGERYLQYPNRDNVLGPTRPFFSTYLESIWLLQLVLAADLLGDAAVTARLADRVVQPSLELVASFDEGQSNRQVWNNAALLAGARLLGDPALARHAVLGPSGLHAHLERGLLEDGSWYEGENYHLFAHRGLWYGVALAERAGITLDAPLVARFDSGFAAPFLTALPDFTFPARRDSQWGITLRQWRIADWCEVGAARCDDPRLRTALARMYLASVPQGDTQRDRSAADVERHSPSVRLTRADLGWRSLLFARESLSLSTAEAPGSVLMSGQGFAILRRSEGDACVALDYGVSGGGHGHPDRLNLLLVDRDARWLDDMGTGSYVDPSLHWYRSTLAHQAPLVNGASQQEVNGHLLAWDERGDAGWVAATAEIAPGVEMVRCVVTMKGYLVDELTWSADHHVTVDLPWHVDASTSLDARMTHAEVRGAGGLEDGFDAIRGARRVEVSADTVVRVNATRTSERKSLTGFIELESGATLWSAEAPAQPVGSRARFLAARVTNDEGTIRSVWCWDDSVQDVTIDGEVAVTLRDGTRQLHRRTEYGWRVETQSAGKASTIELAGVVPEEFGISAIDAREAGQEAPEPRALPSHFELAESHWRRSEESWTEAGSPRADVRITAHVASVLVEVNVHKHEMHFVPPGAVNALDNEPPDINGDGIQLYAALGEVKAGWMIIPDPASNTARVRSLSGWLGGVEVEATAVVRPDGYRVTAVIPVSASLREISLGVIVNESSPERERRRGQLVLGGARGEFVYLRGDRHDPPRLLSFALPDG
ncbi:MAG: Heparinase family protein [Gemmatimonadetes bacterium]|nr:Heparinase family protein [Gemmatimonadota bacterium]